MSLRLASRKRRIALLSLVSAVLCLEACSGGSEVARLATAMRPETAKAFGKLVETYNKGHVGSEIAWTNAASEASLAADASVPWVVVSAATARQMATRASFTRDISPKLLAGFNKGFADLRRTAADESMLPLLATEPVMLCDVAGLEKGGSAVPVTVSDILKGAQVHRRKTGRYLFSPAFGDPDQVMRFMWTQGASLSDKRGTPTFPAGELPALMSPWLERFRAGDLPKAAFGWSETDAAKRMIAGESNAVMGGAAAVTLVASRPDKTSRRFNFFRPVTGVVEEQWLEPIGLVHRQSALMSLAEQNMVAFLLSAKAQEVLAEGYEAVPLTEAGRALHDVAGRTPAIESYLSAVQLFVPEGVPLMPLEPHRADLAQALQMAFKDAVDGQPVGAAVAKAQQWFQARVAGSH